MLLSRISEARPSILGLYSASSRREATAAQCLWRKSSSGVDGFREYSR